MVRRMLVPGLPIEQLAEITGESVADITGLSTHPRRKAVGRARHRAGAGSEQKDDDYSSTRIFAPVVSVLRKEHSQLRCEPNPLYILAVVNKESSGGLHAHVNQPVVQGTARTYPGGD